MYSDNGRCVACGVLLTYGEDGCNHKCRPENMQRSDAKMANGADRRSDFYSNYYYKRIEIGFAMLEDDDGEQIFN